MLVGYSLYTKGITKALYTKGVTKEDKWLKAAVAATVYKGNENSRMRASDILAVGTVEITFNCESHGLGYSWTGEHFPWA